MRRRDSERDEFADFVAAHQAHLLDALVARYGPSDGRAAAVDALSWAWEHWDRVSNFANPVGYLFRVGQSASRRWSTRPIPWTVHGTDAAMPESEPQLVAALGRLSEQQRLVVCLVHAFGWTQADVAGLLDIAPSTVAAHLSRALDRLRSDLEGLDACRP